MQSFIDVQNLSYQYGERKALDNLSFSVNRGEIFGFLGPNGGGKTTTFKILSTLFSVQPGQVTVGGRELFQGQAEDPRENGRGFSTSGFG